MSENQITVEPIYASGKHDPGCRDLFGDIKKKIDEHRGESMDNLRKVPNEGVIVSEFPDYPPTDHLFEIKASYKIEDQKRNYCLVIEDMQYSY